MPNVTISYSLNLDGLLALLWIFIFGVLGFIFTLTLWRVRHENKFIISKYFLMSSFCWILVVYAIIVAFT